MRFVSVHTGTSYIAQLRR